VIENNHDEAKDAAFNGAQKENYLHYLKETAILIASALIMAYLFKTFFFQPFKVEMSSMSPTILSGERIIVSKMTYKLGEPQMGDVITFYSPEQAREALLFGIIPVKQKKILVKRIIAVEGDKIAFKTGKLFINKRSVGEFYLKSNDSSSNMPETIIPKDDVFVAGDNRNNSKDSRMFGPIEKESIIGKALFIYWPLDSAKIFN
jgi:signal peptidase I